MSLKTQLTDDMKQAMRDRNSLKLNTIRFLLSELKNVEIDNGEQDDAGVQKVIARVVKQMRDAVGDFARGGRQDIVDEENKKIAILETYLPKQLGDEELQALVREVVAKMPGAQMGQVIGVVMGQVKGQADGGRVSAAVKQALL